MKRKITIVLFMQILCLCVFALPVSAIDPIQVYVTISNKNLELARKKVVVEDADSDGKLTIYDALYYAHADNYPDGAVGFGCEQTDYGLSMTKLWGYESGSGFGYFCNHKSANNLTDIIHNNDTIDAFAYSDTDSFSDTYCYFQIDEVEKQLNDKLDLILTAQTYDENWNPITVPIENAIILMDGTKTDYHTDCNGKVSIILENSGDHIISASSSKQIIVPPVCSVKVLGDRSQSVTSKYGKKIIVIASISVALLAIISVSIVIRRRRERA